MGQVILIEHDVCLREFSLASMRCLPKVIQTISHCYLKFTQVPLVF